MYPYSRYHRSVVRKPKPIIHVRGKFVAKNKLPTNRRLPIVPLPPSVSIPGFEKAFSPNTNHWMRAIWICSIFAFYGLCIFQLVDRVELYLDGPIFLRTFVTNVKDVPFPAITVCPTGLKDFVKTNFCPRIPKLNTTNSQEFVNRSRECNFDELNTTLEKLWNKHSILNYLHIISAATSCIKRVNTTLCDHALPARTSLVKTFWGTCLTVIPAKRLPYRGDQTYIRITVNRNGDNDTVFILHDATIVPRHRVSVHYERVRHGYQVDVTFLSKQFQYLSTKESPCVEEEKASRCENECINNYLNETVHCRFPFMLNSTKPVCEDYLDLYVGFFYVSSAYDSHDGCNCPRRCNQTIMTINADNFRSREKNSTILTLRYPDNSLEITTEKLAYTLPSLISDIGGNLGFCVGLCLFSFVEVLHFLCQTVNLWVKALFLRCRRR